MLMNSHFIRCEAGLVGKPEKGSVLMVSILTLAVLTLMAAALVRAVIPRLNVTYQSAGWQEARLASEAGIDMAMERLNSNLPTPVAPNTDWSGWKLLTTGSDITTGECMSYSNATQVDAQNNLKASPWVYLDNVALQGTNTSVDVQVQALYPNTDPSSTNIWFRIRSMGTGYLSGPPRSSMDKMDAVLRRLNLVTMRASLRGYDVGDPTEVPLPSASRVIEVLVKPVSIFDKAILTDKSITFGNSDGPYVASWNSATSLNHQYPEGVTPVAEENDPDGTKPHLNGDIATNGTAALGITGNKVKIYGDVSTGPGGSMDNESLIQGGCNFSDDFNRDLPVIEMPDTTTANGGVILKVGDQGSNINPVVVPVDSLNTTYLVVDEKDTGKSHDLGPVTFTGTGSVKVLVKGKWDIGTGNGATVVVPSSVKAEVYVSGGINFGNGNVNQYPASSGVPGNLQIFGTAAKGTNVTASLAGSGNPVVACTFYGPAYTVHVSGGGNGGFYGAIVANLFDIGGGGKASIHYDETLEQEGHVDHYQVAGYYEDTRR